MKKLTAGILTVMLGIVAANSADASIASRGYVDAQVGTKVDTSDFNTFKETNTAEINAAKKAGTDAKDALDAYQTTNDAAVVKKADTATVNAELAKKQNKLVSTESVVINDDNTITLRGIATDAGLTTLQTTVGEHTSALNTLNGTAETEGSVAKSIADAVKDMETKTHAGATYATKTEMNAVDGKFANYTTTENMNAALDLKADKTTVSAMDTAYKAADTAINTKIGTVPEGKNVVTMIEEAKTAATYDDTALANRVTAIENTGIDAGKVAQIETNKTEVAKVAKDLADNYTKTADLSALAKAEIPATCTDPKAANGCALILKNGVYSWEVVERDTTTENN